MVNFRRLRIIFELLGVGLVLFVGLTNFPNGKISAQQMVLTEKYNTSQIKDKYQLDGVSLVRTEVKNAELDKYKNEPKDEIKIIVGDNSNVKEGLFGSTEAEFTPSIELKRWNEVSFKIIPKDLDKVLNTDKTLSFEGDKIKFNTPKISFEMYETTEGEGGYKYIWFLNEKPATNKVEFDIETSGLDFFYQPPLNVENTDPSLTCTETQCTKDGVIVMERPENVVGSYAVYHSTKGGMNDTYGKDYKVGKAFHIYRPHLIDANGLESWGNLHIENGIYSVEIPQDFLDKAVYPIKSNDTFGYTGEGGSYNNISTDEIYMRKGVPGSTGVVDNIRASIALTNAGSTNYQHGLYNSDLSLVSPQTDTGTINSTTKQWWILNFSGGPTVIGSNTYYVATFVDGLGDVNYIKFYKDTGGVSGDSKYVDGTTYNSWPNPPTAGNSTSIYSIYATYTPSGGGTTANSPTLNINDQMIIKGQVIIK